MQVREILAVKGKVLYTIAPEKKLSEAAATMSEHDVGSLACFDHGRMAGMLTFREVLKVLHARGAAWGSVTVGEVMVRDPVVGLPEMQVDELRRLMVEKHMRYLPIMEGDTLLGVISFHDVAKAVLDEQGFENRMLKAYISDWSQDTQEEARA
ncbi:MAG TPA: CBS domain-containing protein [Rhodocyclaceae bacterium]|nr:CBS domain-containing protein [Rhodocyclaceae bacterium]